MDVFVYKYVYQIKLWFCLVDYDLLLFVILHGFNISVILAFL